MSKSSQLLEHLIELYPFFEIRISALKKLSESKWANLKKTNDPILKELLESLYRAIQNEKRDDRARAKKYFNNR